MLKASIVKWFFVSAAICAAGLIASAQPAIAQAPPSTLPVAKSRDLRSLTPEQYLWLKYPSDAPILDRVVNCESGWNPAAKNAESSASGLFQFLASTWATTRAQMGRDPDLDLRLNPYENVDTAVFLYRENGLSPWACAKIIRV